jgi:SAM-dependent methyltransferase
MPGHTPAAYYAEQTIPQMKERPNEAATSSDFEFGALSEAKNYRHALVREFSPFLKGRVIEIGSGIGQLTALFRQLPAVECLQCVEPDAAFCEEFRRVLPGHPLIHGTIKDVPGGTDWEAIVSINVLEHIREDDHELQAYRQLLRKRQGFLNLFVPARQEIYAPIDRDFGHYRRYSLPELKRKLAGAGFYVKHIRYFNFAGYFAWWAVFRLLRKRHFNAGSVRLFDRLIFPAVYGVESAIMAPPLGQSLLAVARAIE